MSLNLQSADSLENENKLLASKIEALEQQKRKTIKMTAKPKLKPFGKKVFTPQVVDYGSVRPRDYTTVMNEHTAKIEDLRKQREAEEMGKCTFKPRINRNTEKYIDKTGYIPVHERKVESRNQSLVQEDSQAFESFDDSIEPEKQKVARRMDPNFYEKQIQWNKRKAEKLQRQKERMESLEYAATHKEVKSDRKEDKGRGTKGDFIERMEHYKQKSTIKQKQLEEKVHNYTFKPKLNPTDHVQSRVMRPKTSLYQWPNSNFTI